MADHTGRSSLVLVLLDALPSDWPRLDCRQVLDLTASRRDAALEIAEFAGLIWR